MYKWKIDISLKSGQNITGLYVGSENNSVDVAKVLLENDPTVTVFAIASLDGNAQLFVMRNEVAAMGISFFAEPIDNQETM